MQVNVTFSEKKQGAFIRAGSFIRINKICYRFAIPSIHLVSNPKKNMMNNHRSSNWLVMLWR